MKLTVKKAESRDGEAEILMMSLERLDLAVPEADPSFGVFGKVGH